MFLLIVIVILIAAASILGNIYVSFFSFQENYGDLENYSNSNYVAISAIERGLLVSKHKSPSFVGSGGFIGTGDWGEVSDLFSGNFGKINENNNGLYREIDSQCDTISGYLTNQNTITISTYEYNNSIISAYQTDSAISTDGISDNSEIKGILSNINQDINLINGNIYRQINGNNEISGETGFIASSGNTMIKYSAINDKGNIIFANTTINPIVGGTTGDVLCTQNGCYTGQSISDLIDNDKGLSLYIQDRLLDNNNQIGQIKFELNNNFNGNCQNYYITGTSIIGKYKQELIIKKPTYNYRNPNRKKFIFPYYN